MTTASANNRIYVAGHHGMVGSAIIRALNTHAQSSDQPIELITRTHAQLDLTDQQAVNRFFEQQTPQQVYIAAAKVGGIYANNHYPAEFIYQNVMMAANMIDAAFRNGVKKLLFLGSSCIYPKHAPQPMDESALLTGTLEATNEPYAIAKIAGIKLCESYNRQYGESHDIDYRSVMPTNLYGPGDNYHPQNSHVIPALIQRFHHAKQQQLPTVTIWGSGTPRREFLYVEDMADACVHVMNLEKTRYQQQTSPMCSHINVGSGQDITIQQLAQQIKHVTAYQGDIVFDASRPDGTPRKLMASQRLSKLGWQASVSLSEGLLRTYQAYLREQVSC